MPTSRHVTLALLLLAGCDNAFPVLSGSSGDAATVVRARIDDGDGVAHDWVGSEDGRDEGGAERIVGIGYLHTADGAVAARLALTLPIDCDFGQATTLMPVLSLPTGAACGTTMSVEYEEAGPTAFPSGNAATAITGTIALEPQSQITPALLGVRGHLDVTLTDAAGQQRHIVAGFDLAGAPPDP